MNPKQFNGIYRPLVQQAWLSYCQRRGTAPNNKSAYNIWYQSLLMDITGGKLHSTKGASPKMQRFLIDHFKTMVGKQSSSILIEGRWSEAQIAKFSELAKAAYNAAQTSEAVPDFPVWIRSICQRNGYSPAVSGALYFPDLKESFDLVMADLAVIANDEYWISRTSSAAEKRMRWQINQFLGDLDFLDKRFSHKWDYVRGIYKQSAQLPSDIDDCPAQTLWKVLQMLDTHIRRLCKDFDVAPADLPSRAHPHAHIKINEQAHHLHVGHSLEHCQPVEVHSEELEAVPF